MIAVDSYLDPKPGPLPWPLAPPQFISAAFPSRRCGGTLIAAIYLGALLFTFLLELLQTYLMQWTGQKVMFGHAPPDIPSSAEHVARVLRPQALSAASSRALLRRRRAQRDVHLRRLAISKTCYPRLHRRHHGWKSCRSRCSPSRLSRRFSSSPHLSAPRSATATAASAPPPPGSTPSPRSTSPHVIVQIFNRERAPSATSPP